MQRWMQISADPNSTEVSQARWKAIQSIRTGKLIDDRVRYLSDAVRGRRILDIGVVAHTEEATEEEGWLHGALRSQAAECLGVDILEEPVAALRERGFDVVVADLTKAPMDRQFDVIIAGEVLEHLGEPGIFLRNCAMMLEPTGRLFVTVPNPWYFNVVVKNLRRGTSYIDSADHVVWFDANSLYELGQRNGLQLTSYSGISIGRPAGALARMLMGLVPLLTLLGVAKEVFAKSVLYEFAKGPAT